MSRDFITASRIALDEGGGVVLLIRRVGGGGEVALLIRRVGGGGGVVLLIRRVKDVWEVGDG